MAARRTEKSWYTVCERFGLSPTQLAGCGAFNVPLLEDAPYFIDPRLLAKTKIPEFKGAAPRAYEFFAGVMNHVAKSRQDGAYRAAALEALEFKETPGLMLGTSETCQGGRGVGPKLAHAMFETMREFIDAGLRDPALLGVMVVVQKDFGPDRISDMVASINLDGITRYSARVFSELGVTGEDLPGHDGLRLPLCPCGRHPILLIPREILRPLDNTDPYRAWFGGNEDLRRFFSERIQEQYKDYQAPTKADYRRVFLKHPEKFGELAKTFREADPEPYDFTKDPKGLQPVDKALDVARSHQMPVELAKPTTPAAFQAAVLAICDHFKLEAETSSVLRDGEGNALGEKKVQAVFRAVASGFARQLGIDLNSEPNNGRGPVDFKFSIGTMFRTLVEVKLASNQDILRGYDTQLEVYRKQEPNSSAIYLVVAYQNEFNVKSALEEKRRLQASDAAPTIVFVDASLKPSASKARVP